MGKFDIAIQMLRNLKKEFPDFTNNKALSYRAKTIIRNCNNEHILEDFVKRTTFRSDTLEVRRYAIILEAIDTAIFAFENDELVTPKIYDAVGVSKNEIGPVKEIILEKAEETDNEYISKKTFFWTLGSAITIFLASNAGIYKLGYDNGYSRFEKEKIEMFNENRELHQQVDGYIQSEAKDRNTIGDLGRKLFIADSTIKAMQRKKK